MYKDNHTLVTDEWRYIRYADGTEELYNERTDPNEWTNVAARPENMDVKKKVAEFLPKKNAEPVKSSSRPRRKRRGDVPSPTENNDHQSHERN